MAYAAVIFSDKGQNVQTHWIKSAVESDKNDKNEGAVTLTNTCRTSQSRIANLAPAVTEEADRWNHGCV